MIDRETIIERSVDAYLRAQLFGVRNYPQDKVVILDAFPTSTRMNQPLDRNYIAIGWSTDDGGVQAELGTSLKRHRFTFDFYVFGLSRVWGRNLASVIRYSLESDQSINLLDPADPTGETVLGNVIVDYVSAQQATVPDPRPWQENAWIVRLRVEDYYSSAAGG